MGTPFGSAEAIRRMMMPTLDLYTHGLYTDERMMDAAASTLAGDPSTGGEPRSDKGPGNPNQDPDPPRASSDIST
jgi:hypothetical protein